jgi:uncharacterized repeat protein (TIGR02543 family)
MRKNIIFALLLIVAQGAWADEYYPDTSVKDKTEGPWTFVEVTNDCSPISPMYYTVTYNKMDHSSWDEYNNDHPITYLFKDGDGIGFAIHCKSVYGSNYGVMSIYAHDEVVPAGTCATLTWKFQLGAQSNRYAQGVVLYRGGDDLEALKNTKVDYTAGNWGMPDNPLRIGRAFVNNTDEKKTAWTEELTATFEFDNRDSSTPQTKRQYIMLVCIAENNRNEQQIPCHQWGSFLDKGSSWSYTYSKILVYDANGGEGTMSSDVIVENGVVKENTFTREHYTFAGWSTQKNGEVEYHGGEPVTVTESDHGEMILYAQWTPVSYTISYELGEGGTTTGPMTYTIETEDFVLNYPTRPDYTFAGWTGSNGETPEMQVTVKKGTFGDLTYTAHWISAAVINAKIQIAVLDKILYTPESKVAIETARAAYDELTEEEKELMTAAELEKLQVAEATFAALYPSSINFVEQDGTTSVGEAQEKAIYYPAAPKEEDQTFTHWQTVKKNASEDKTIVIKAVYE